MSLADSLNSPILNLKITMMRWLHFDEKMSIYQFLAVRTLTSRSQGQKGEQNKDDELHYVVSGTNSEIEADCCRPGDEH